MATLPWKLWSTQYMGYDSYGQEIYYTVSLHPDVKWINNNLLLTVENSES